MTEKIKRAAFFISDGTGITAGSLGGLLAHFPETDFEQIRVPFTDSISKIEEAQKISFRLANDKLPPNMSSLPNIIWGIPAAMISKKSPFFLVENLP